ncbi:hypothetical protein CUR178_07939 [Leishmania enriettii]|uniref:Uncharacterized protein n=1 Tax=Leishmania enriettii TaxID=5663 RepID=A0A836HI04_LEIEN|nr:hypothetical protein CUR178_07939 [Leishmania enriettii]
MAEGNADTKDDVVVVLGGVAGYGVAHWNCGASSVENSGVSTPQQPQRAQARAGLLERQSRSRWTSLGVTHTRGGLPQRLAQRTAPASGVSAASVAYTNFATDVDWRVYSGLIAMRASGQWTLLEPAASANSFACAFKADFTSVPPDTVSSSRSVNENGAYSSSAGSTSSSGGGSSSGVPQ